MTAATEPGPRIVALDFLRGIAVMGIFAMNVLNFGLPEQAYVNPAAYGGSTGADLWAWLLAFVFVEGKMRALFSLLFGASMLLVIDRAEAGGQDGSDVHKRRMFWLLILGLIHYFFIWKGDILSLYAVIGLVAYLFSTKAPRALLGWSIVFFAVSLIIYAMVFSSALLMQTAASLPNPDPLLVEQWEAVKMQVAPPRAEVLARNLALYQGNYGGVLRYQLAQWSLPFVQILMYGPETLALMLLGMWGFRSGFMTGEWSAARYRKWAFICLAISIPAFALVASAVADSGFDPALTFALHGLGGFPFRPVMVIGYAALILLFLKHGAESRFKLRIAAAGRAAFTNYLGTSILATALFYGWGFGLYGRLGRAELYLVVLAVWALMLFWSKPWLDRYRYGPFEWLWRSLARGERQPMRHAAAAV